MKWCKFLLLLAMFFMLSFGPLKAQEERLTLVTGDNYPPVTSRNLPYGGLGTYIVSRAFELGGMQISEIKWQPWARGYGLTQVNIFDAAFPWGETQERHKDFYFSEPIVNMIDFAFVLKRSDLYIRDFKDLEKHSYCNPNGYGDYGMIKKMTEEGRMKRYSPIDMVSCFKMLAQRRVDMVISPTWEARYAINKAQIDPSLIRQEKLKVWEQPLSLITSKKNKRGPEIIKAFNKGLHELKESGEFRKIYDEFNFDYDQE